MKYCGSWCSEDRVSAKTVMSVIGLKTGLIYCALYFILTLHYALSGESATMSGGVYL
jgi:hypothetical protein